MVKIIDDNLLVQNTTHQPGTKPDVVVLLDASGSMGSHADQVISTFNEYVESVRDTAHTISLFTFDSNGIRQKLLRVPPARVPRLGKRDYVPSAMTPLYDAMGVVITKFIHNDRPVQFVTHTDGAENSSEEWNFNAIDELMKIRQKQDNWLFVHLGEGIEGRDQMQSFTGLKMNFDSQSRDQVMRSLGDTTVMYAAVASADATQYTTNGSDTVNIGGLADDGDEPSGLSLAEALSGASPKVRTRTPRSNS